jgi:hypothetical protein
MVERIKEYAKNASSMFSFTSWEWGSISWFVSRSQHERVALGALTLSTFLFHNSCCSFKHTYSEMARVTFQAPTFFVVVLEDEVTFKTLNTEIYHLLLRLISIKILSQTITLKEF